jgi:hypothetical protein
VTQEVAASGSAITAFVDELVVALVNTRIYWSAHPRAIDAIDALRGALAQLATGELPLELRLIGDGLEHAGSPLWEASLSAKALIRSLRERGAGGLSCHPLAQAADFQALLDVLADERARARDVGEHNAALVAAGCRWIRLLPPAAPHRSSGFRPPLAATRTRPPRCRTR